MRDRTTHPQLSLVTQGRDLGQYVHSVRGVLVCVLVFLLVVLGTYLYAVYCRRRR